MRLRLAATHSSSRSTDVAPATVPNSAAAPATGDAPALNHLVWNSVLESLSTTMTTIASAFPHALNSASTPQVKPEGLAPLAAAPHAAPAHSTVNSAGAPLFVPSPPIDFSSLPIAAPPDVAPPVITPATPEPSVVAGQPEPLAVAVVAESVLAAPAPAAPDAPVTGGPVGTDVMAPAMPTLTPPSRAAAAPKPAPTMLVDPDASHSGAAKKRKKKKRPIRTLFTLIVVLGMIGGAAYAGYYYFVRPQVQWPSDVEPMASFVEQTLDHDFSENVTVEILEPVEYETKLGVMIFDRYYKDSDGSFSTLRSVGLLSGPPSAADIGHVAAASMTSFYEPADGTIYALEGDTAVFEVSMLRSLTNALLDQELEWSAEMSNVDDAQRVGYRALIDGVANRVVSARIADEPELGTQSAAELATRQEAAGADKAGVSFAADGFLASVATGVDLPLADSDDVLSTVDVPMNDAVVLDPARVATGDAPAISIGATGSSPGRVLGMQFWYEAMLPVLGADSARAAALLWVDDNSAVTNVANHPCLTSEILTGSEADQLAMANYLTQWAGSRPPSSTATVTPEGGNLVTVSVCQPTEGVAAPMNPVGTSDLYTTAKTEWSFLEQMLAIQLPDTPAARQCAVFAYRSNSVPNFSPGSTDPTLAEAMANVVTFCKGA